MQAGISYKIQLDYSADVKLPEGEDNNLYWWLTLNDGEPKETQVMLSANELAAWDFTPDTTMQTVAIQLFAKYGNALDESYVTWHRFSVIPHASGIGEGLS